MTSDDVDTSRRRLQWMLAASAAAPTLSGALQILRGAQGAPGNPHDVSATIDAELRYANVFKAAAGPIIWSQLDKADTSPVVTAALGTIFVGGMARLLSWHQSGKPHPAAMVAIGLEVGVVPILMAWRHRMAAQTA
ncbi:uncharacterized protein DUF4345 [Williamsia limnetica]|uniref:Uncharacterized protein DUF4345 n=1 Tax=Williamsia limnetica TaxID=882452 RepID=A0A318RH68_WILLI|nr:DUF4345 domain-containing protein [Williamsia limnetica]PYE12472.1 uncharacterized protein DUF4345 [Williamsia limnetica]